MRRPQSALQQKIHVNFAKILKQDLLQGNSGSHLRILHQVSEHLLDDPIQHLIDLVKLDDRDYYALRLSKLLPSYLLENRLDSSDKLSKKFKVREILIGQARHLMAQGLSLRLDKHERLEIFGNDRYIAGNIAQIQSASQCPESVDLGLQQIAYNANLMGIEAVATLYRFPQYRFGFELPENFSLEDWEVHWETEMLSVPYNRDRVIAFVRDRFDQVIEVGVG